MTYDLQSIGSTRNISAPKIVLVGPNKIGKTTFASSAPNAVGILTENGASAVDAQAFPICTSLSEVYQCLTTLINETHSFKTVFLDSLDWFEPMLHQYVCEVNRWTSIDSVSFGRGYIAATEQWRHLLSGFEKLRTEKGMTIILIAHDKVKRMDSPLHESYDTYTMKLHDRASGLIMEWADIVGYCSHKIITRSTDIGFGQKETKALTTGERILHVEPHPAHCGGNRFSMRDAPLQWEAFYSQFQTINSEPSCH